MPRPRKPAPDKALLYRVAELVIQKGQSDKKLIADQLNAEFPGRGLTRESIYPLLTEAVKAKIVQVVPPFEEVLSGAIESKFGLSQDSVRVVASADPRSNRAVADFAATQAFDLLKDLSRKIDGPVGVGLGPGRATLDFAQTFSQLLSNDISRPRLNLVALSAGTPAKATQFSPISYFNLFNPENVAECIGLFGPTLLQSADLAKLKKTPGVREAFAAKEEDRIHIVVTSMGDMEDSHSLLRQFYDESGTLPAVVREAVGDVQYRPYKADGFIREGPKEYRAVTLFELDELVRLAATKDRYVILIARQCGACALPRTRARPLRPLLDNPAMRVFSHLVLDSPTARELAVP